VPILAPAAVALLIKINRDYLDLLIAGWQEGAGLLDDGVMTRLGGVPAEVLDSIAGCSYALFALEFPADVSATRIASQVHDPVTERYSTAAGEAGAWPAVITTAWFYAWHLSRNSPLSARVMLGLSIAGAEELARLDPWQLRHIAGRQPAPLSPRWRANPCFWPDLVRFADNQNPLRLSAARLLGMQLLAADMVPLPTARERR
jgi:hypothetical protein